MKVQVEDAPGYEDFEGELIVEVASVDGRLFSVVAVEVDGTRYTEMVPSYCVRELNPFTPE